MKIVKINHNGYVTVASKSLHIMVWEAVNGPTPKGYEIHHKDLHPLHNEIENLECLTHLEHFEIHHKGKPRTDVWKAKTSESMKRVWAKRKNLDTQ
jgi:hypothetical protein